MKIGFGVVVLTLIGVDGCRGSTPKPAVTAQIPTTQAPACSTQQCTVVDLTDTWTPKLFAIGPDGKAPEFRETYLKLAATADSGEELYGVVPAYSVVRDRLAQTARHRCHAAIDNKQMLALVRPWGQEHDPIAKMNVQTRTYLGAQLERVKTAKKLPDYSSLATDREFGQTYERWKLVDDQVSGIMAAQQHLVCEGFLAPKDVDGSMSWKMGTALENFQRKNFLIPNNRLDPETRAALATDPIELDYRLALRVLRERVVDATGLIEDGSAGDGGKPINGRLLDPEVMRQARGHEKPLADAAPDLVSAATEAAAKELGWIGPVETAAYFAAHHDGERIALPLPAVPAYHSPHMDISAEVDRGDVWYDEQPIPRFVAKRPNFVLYVNDNGTKRPLVRWPSTIGGWADVSTGNGVVQRWKESDVGPRVWRDLYAAPTWLPPGSTPDRELVKWVGTNKWDLKRSIMGPGPHGAFGIVLLPHYKVVKNAKGGEDFVDNGIGTHGSAVVSSIFNGTSHGCHRLYNQLAVRLGSFLLAHRAHVVKGQTKEFYRRNVNFMGHFQARIDTRGFLYELTPPVPVNVLPGNIRSARQVPPLASAPAHP